MKENKTTTPLNDISYISDRNYTLSKIIQGAESSNSEATTAAIFENQISYLLRKHFDIEPKITKEESVNGLIHSYGNLRKRVSGQGRLDAVINNLIVEYKHHTKLINENDITLAIEQVKDYLSGLDKQCHRKHEAILTDGTKICYFSFTANEIRHTSLRPIEGEDIDIILQAIINNNLKKLDPENIVRDFYISQKTNTDSRRLAQVLFKHLSASLTDKTFMLFSEWESLSHLSVNDSGKSRDIEKRRKDLSVIINYSITKPEEEYRALFALQTTYAIIVKLIACKVVDNLNFKNSAGVYHDLLSLNVTELQKFFAELEEGYSYSSGKIHNFLEGDFFSWYSDSYEWKDDLYDPIKNIIKKVDDYTAFSIDVDYSPVDIFKNLYMKIIPQSVRHSMGEYFTPEWLADSVITEGLNLIYPDKKDEWKAIDPCCGSGIFLVCLIKKLVGNTSLLDLSKNRKQQLLSQIIERVYGIDINPLSVLSARVSYYLALHKLGEVRDIDIPVYLGDSAIIPQIETIDGIDCYRCAIDNLKCGSLNVILPVRMVKDKSFVSIMNDLQALVKVGDAEILYSSILKHLNEKEKASTQLKQHIHALSKNLIYLHTNHWDGIWIRISMNFLCVARLQSFDFIVGNPPWVKWEHLPSVYTRKIKALCDIKHIFSNDGGMYGGAQLNICALIANVTATNWLTKQGVQAFLMPDSIMSQNSYEEFRNFYLDYDSKKRLYLQKIDRWKAPLRPFKVDGKSITQDFNTYFFAAPEIDYTKGIPVTEITKKSDAKDFHIDKQKNWTDVSRYLIFTQATAKQLSPNSTAFTFVTSKYNFDTIIGQSHYLYRTGVESTPFEVFKLIAVGSCNNPNNYRFKNDVRKTARYKVTDTPIGGWEFETRYIYPIVQGPSIKPFCYDYGNSFHIIPYRQGNTKEPISWEDLYKESPNVATYFANHIDLLNAQSEKSKTMHRGAEVYALSKIGPYTFAKHIVAARDNSNFCASVINQTKTPWGETKQTICVKHTIIISQDTDGNFITEDEAHYINGVLNSRIVKEYIHSTFKKNGFSLKKSNIFLPKYQSNNPLFTQIADKAKEATANANNPQIVTQSINELSELYIKLCEALNKKKDN